MTEHITYCISMKLHNIVVRQFRNQRNTVPTILLFCQLGVQFCLAKSTLESQHPKTLKTFCIKCNLTWVLLHSMTFYLGGGIQNWCQKLCIKTWEYMYCIVFITCSSTSIQGRSHWIQNLSHHKLAKSASSQQNNAYTSTTKSNIWKPYTSLQLHNIPCVSKI
jgi:hypothetical protein